MNKRTALLALLDCIMAASSLYVAFFIRFEFSIPKNFYNVFIDWLPFFTLLQVLVFFFAGLYKRIWRYTSLFDLYAIVAAVALSSGISFIFILFSYGSEGYPRSVLILYLILNTILTTAIRLSVRVYYSHYHRNSTLRSNKERKILLLIGAGKTGDKIAREILTTSRNEFTIAGFIDDNPDKHGALLHGKKIFCGLERLPTLKIDYDEILITSPSATGNQMRNIVKACKQTGKKYKTVPGFNEIISEGEITLAARRDVSYADLLGREEIKLDMNAIEKMLNGKRILITGAGGSIGFELVNQCLLFKPAEIICLDNSEQKIYDISQFSKNIKSNTIIKCVLATINNKKELERVFIDNRPQIVFHAAAYKHVPIQENHSWTAVKTNIGGTKNIVELCDDYSVNKFVLVSTDKAVNPTNVMGATKRVSEKLIQSFNLSSGNCCYMSVRFGNVLGSSGSAIPTFEKQIKDGGPITITHPEMTRYFMSIQEASQLILQCGSFGKDGEIFLLEMGKPIKILNMAKDLIRLSGFEPEIDIPIVFTGLRPGEKLYEELQLKQERKIKTQHKKIMVLKDSIAFLPWQSFSLKLNRLLSAAENLDAAEIQSLLKEILPTYNPQNLESRSTDYFYTIKGQA